MNTHQLDNNYNIFVTSQIMKSKTNILINKILNNFFTIDIIKTHTHKKKKKQENI